MKKVLLLLLLVSLGLQIQAQITTNADTVCVGAIGEQYFVTNTPGSTYQWNVGGASGAVLQSNGANSTTIDWGSISGLYLDAVTVIETSAEGCLGELITLDVFILSPTANIIGPFCSGNPPTTLIGDPVGGTWSGTGVTGNNFNPNVGQGNYILTYDVGGCITTINVIVNNGPITGPIQHF